MIQQISHEVCVCSKLKPKSDRWIYLVPIILENRVGNCAVEWGVRRMWYKGLFKGHWLPKHHFQILWQGKGHLFCTLRQNKGQKAQNVLDLLLCDEQSINYISFWMIYVALRNEVIILFLGPSERSSVLRIMAKRRSVLDDPHFDVHYWSRHLGLQIWFLFLSL